MFGVRGEVKVYLHNPESDLLRAPREVILVGPQGRRRPALLSVRPGAGKRILGRIEGIDDRDRARELIGWRVHISRSALPEPEEGEHYVWELEGLEVFAQGQRLGVVSAVHPTAGGDVFEIATDGEPLFVPAVQAWIAHLDVSGRRMELTAHPGAEAE